MTRALRGAVAVMLVVVGIALVLAPGLTQLDLVPRQTRPLDPHDVVANGGHAYTVRLPFTIRSDRDGVSPLVVLEDGRPLPHAHALHDAIRTEGNGRYSHWDDVLYLSASDGSDIRSNGREYSVSAPLPLLQLLPSTHSEPLLALAALLILAGFRLAPGSTPSEPDDERVDLGRPAGRAERAGLPGPVLGVALLCGALAVGAYVYAATLQATLVNTEARQGDQSAYMDLARDWHVQGASFVAERSRMPVLPWLLKQLLGSDTTQPSFFPQAKAFTIALSLLLLAGLFLFVRRSLSLCGAVALIAAAAFSVFVLKSAWVQAEPLFYSLGFAAACVMAASFGNRSLPAVGVAGLLAAVAHLTKAAMLPLVGIYLALLTVQSVHRMISAGRDDRRRWLALARPLIVGVVFLAVLWPYASESKRVFGQYSYNVNTTFYMWCDSWAECKQGVRAHGGLVGWPDMPASELPGPSKWIDQHGWSGAVARIDDGLARLWATQRQSRLGYWKYAVFHLAFALLCLTLRPRAAASFLRRHSYAAALVLSALPTYVLAFAWYTPVVDEPRFALALCLPLLFLCAVIARQASAWYAPVAWGRRRCSVAGALTFCTFALIVGDVCRLVTSAAMTVSGGH